MAPTAHDRDFGMALSAQLDVTGFTLFMKGCRKRHRIGSGFFRVAVRALPAFIPIDVGSEKIILMMASAALNVGHVPLVGKGN
jgi:hypothetical protein